MGLLYRWFGVRPTTIDEGVDFAKTKGLDNVVIAVDRESIDDCAAMFGVSSGFVELRTGKKRVKEYGAEISYTDDICTPGKTDNDNTRMLLFALRKKHELNSVGIACSVFFGGKTVNDDTIRTLRLNQNQLTHLKPPVPAHVYTGSYRH